MTLAPSLPPTQSPHQRLPQTPGLAQVPPQPPHCPNQLPALVAADGPQQYFSFRLSWWDGSKHVGCPGKRNSGLFLSHFSGLHTWQVSLGCELREDESKGGFLHYGYNGMDFISFDKETLRWVTAQPQAQKVKEKWEDDTRKSQRNIIYLEETCINMMQKYLPYQKEALLQTEPPVGKVTRKVVDDSLEVLICQAFGFYPREIQATWMRDGEVCQYETLHRNVAPNSDGTYYVQLSIEIDPKERDHFQCYLEHEGLQEPLVLALKEEKRERRSDYDVPHFDGTLFLSVGTVIVIIFGAVTLCLIGCCLIFRKKLHPAMKTCLDHLLEKLRSSPTDGTEDEIQLKVMFPPKTTSEGCCGEKTTKRRENISEGFPRCLFKQQGKASSGDFTMREPLKDADAPKPGMEGMEEEVSPGISVGPLEERAYEHLAGVESGETQLQLEDSRTQTEAWDGEGLKLQWMKEDE